MLESSKPYVSLIQIPRCSNGNPTLDTVVFLFKDGKPTLWYAESWLGAYNRIDGGEAYVAIPEQMLPTLTAASLTDWMMGKIVRYQDSLAEFSEDKRLIAWCEKIRELYGSSHEENGKSRMYAQKWNGVGGYDLIVTMNESEMRELTRYYHVDWSFFTVRSPRRHLDDKYYCFVCFSRKSIALLPFLAIAFGGQYNDESPIEDPVTDFHLDYSEYKLEEFNLHGSSETGHSAGFFKRLLKRFFD